MLRVVGPEEIIHASCGGDEGPVDGFLGKYWSLGPRLLRGIFTVSEWFWWIASFRRAKIMDGSRVFQSRT